MSRQWSKLTWLGGRPGKTFPYPVSEVVRRGRPDILTRGSWKQAAGGIHYWHDEHDGVAVLTPITQLTQIETRLVIDGEVASTTAVTCALTVTEAVATLQPCTSQQSSGGACTAQQRVDDRTQLVYTITKVPL